MMLQWRRQLGKFNDSKIGQLFWVAALVYSIYTGFFWTLVFSFLRIVFLVRHIVGSYSCGVLYDCALLHICDSDKSHFPCRRAGCCLCC